MLRNSYLWCDASVFQRTSWPRMQENVRSAWRSWYRETPSLACPASASTTKGMRTCDGKYSCPSVWERCPWALVLQRSDRNASTYISVKVVEFWSFAAGVFVCVCQGNIVWPLNLFMVWRLCWLCTRVSQRPLLSGLRELIPTWWQPVLLLCVYQESTFNVTFKVCRVSCPCERCNPPVCTIAIPFMKPLWWRTQSTALVLGGNRSEVEMRTQRSEWDKPSRRLPKLVEDSLLVLLSPPTQLCTGKLTGLWISS